MQQSHTENNHSIANPTSNASNSQLNAGMKAKSIGQNQEQIINQRLTPKSKQGSDTKVIINRDHIQNQYTSRNQYKSSTFNSRRQQKEGNSSVDQRIEKNWMNQDTNKYQRSYQIQNSIQNTQSGRDCNSLNKQNINTSSKFSRTYQSQNIHQRQGTQSQDRQNVGQTGFNLNSITSDLKVDHIRPQKNGNQQEVSANNLKQNINLSPNRVEYSSSIHSGQNITKTYSTRNFNDKHYQYSLNNRDSETTRAMKISRSRINHGLSLSPGPSSSIHASNINGSSNNRHSLTIASMKIEQKRVISKDEWYISSGKQQSFWLHQQSLSSQFNNNNIDNEHNLQTATECVDRLYKDNQRRLQEREQLLIQRRAKEESEQEVYSFHPEIYSRKARGGSVSARNFSEFYSDQVKFQESILRKREHNITKESEEYHKGQRLQLTKGTQRIISKHAANKSVDNRAIDFEVHTRLYKNQAIIQGQNKKLCNCYKHKTAHTHDQCKTELSLEAQKRILKDQVSSVQRLYVGYRNKQTEEIDNERAKFSQENERYYYSRKTFYKLYKDFIRYFKRDIYFYMFVENEEFYRQVIYKKAMKNQASDNKETTKRTQYDNILIKYSSYLKLMKTIGFMNIQGKQEKEKQFIDQIWQYLNYKKEETIRVENLFIYLCGIMNIDLEILYRKQNHQGHKRIGEWICYCENSYAHYQSYEDLYKLHKKYYSLYLNRKNYRKGHNEECDRNLTFAPKIGWRSKVIAKVVTIEASQLHHTHDCHDPNSRDKAYNHKCCCQHRKNKDEKSIERIRKTNEIISGRKSKFVESNKKQQKRESFSQGYIGQLNNNQKSQEANVVRQGTDHITQEKKQSKKIGQEFQDDNREKQISFGGRQQTSNNLQQKSKQDSQTKQFSFAQQNDNKGQSKKMSKSQEDGNQVFYQGLQITDADEELEITDNQPHQEEQKNNQYQAYQVDYQEKEQENMKQNSFGNQKQQREIYEQQHTEINEHEVIEYSTNQLAYKQKSEQIGDNHFMNDKTTVHDQDQDTNQKLATEESQLSPIKSNLQGYSDNQISTMDFHENNKKEESTEQKASDSENSSKSNSKQGQIIEKKESLTNFTQQIESQQEQHEAKQESILKPQDKEESKEVGNSQQTGENLLGMMSLSLTGGIVRKGANQKSQKTTTSQKTIHRTEQIGESEQNNQVLVIESLQQNEKREETDSIDNKSQNEADGQKAGGGLNISISVSVTRSAKRGMRTSRQNQSSVSVHSAVEGVQLNSQRSVSQFDSQHEETSQYYQDKSEMDDHSQIDQEQDGEGEEQEQEEEEGEEQEVEVEEEYEDTDENGRKVIRKRWVRRIIKTTTRAQGSRYSYKKRNYTGKSSYKYGVSTHRRDSSGSLKKYNQTEHQRQQYITSTFGASYKQKTTGSSGSVTEHHINMANANGSSTQYQSKLYSTNQYQSSSHYKQSNFKASNLQSKSSSAVANFMTSYLKAEKERKTPRKSNQSSQKSLHQYVEQQDNKSSNGSVQSQDSQQRALKIQGSSALTSSITKSLFSKTKITTSTYQTSSPYKSTSKYGQGQTKSTNKKTTSSGKVVTGEKKETKTENYDSHEGEVTQQQDEHEQEQVVDNKSKHITEVKSVQKQSNISSLMGKSLYGQTSTYKTTSNYNQKSLTNNKKKL